MLFVKDLHLTTAFYRDTLGLRVIEETRLDNYVEFDAGPSTFALHAIPAHIAAEIGPLSPKLPRESCPVKLSFEVENVASERKRLEVLGVTILDRPWGDWELVDPEGNIFGIYSRSHGK
jgi:catechol 2,3-dioxygenase-like lactoylglutathione lyase family enzyme